MDLNTFSRRAHELFDDIPGKFREGVDGLTIRAEVLPHPVRPEVYTMGQCLTESYPSEWSGPDTLRSVLVLYHGSFTALSRLDPAFDWEEELWETLTHELRHHLETLANEDALEGVDYAMEEAFRRADGESFDPLYFQAGMEVAPGLFQVEYDFFLQQEWEAEAFEAAREIRFSWHGERWRIPRPELLGDVHYVWIWGPEVGPGTLQLVLLRKRSWAERLRGGGGKGEMELWESEAEATVVEGEEGP